MTDVNNVEAVVIDLRIDASAVVVVPPSRRAMAHTCFYPLLASSVQESSLFLPHQHRHSTKVACFASLDRISSNCTLTMRYGDWDVILFPRDSHVPIQEFKTACYSSQDATRPSAMIESRRQPNQKVVYMVQVVVDGTGLFHDIFDVGSKWPQEIAHEKRALTSSEHRTSQPKPRLEFPPFHPQTLKQAVWESRSTSGRINIILSEQLMSRNSSPGELELGISEEIVCFSFQHAPKDVLEQAGISWPIHNPLYLTSIHEGTYTSSESTEGSTRAGKPRDVVQHDMHMQSPLSHASMSKFSRPHNHEPLQRPSSHPPPFPHFPRPPLDTRGAGRPGTWNDSFGSFRDNQDALSLDSWSTQRTASNVSGDMFLDDCEFTSSQPSQPRHSWANPRTKYQRNVESRLANQRSRREKDREVVLTLRDDQFGQIIEAISPPKRHNGLPMSMATQHGHYISGPPAAHTYYPPKMGSLPVTGKPSAAALARKSSYPDLGVTARTASDRASPDKPSTLNFHKLQPSTLYHPSTSSYKENCPPSQSRLLTPLPPTNRVPPPNPFPRLPQWGADAPSKDTEISSILPSYNQYSARGMPGPPRAHGRHGPARTPSQFGSVRSRKEGLARNSTNLTEHEVRHDQRLLSQISPQKSTAAKDLNVVHNTLTTSPPEKVPDIVEIIDVDAIDPTLSQEAPLDATKLSPYKPNHKAGTSSMDSTGRIEQRMFNALGEELYGFDTHDDTSVIGPELAHALGASLDLSEGPSLSPAANDFEPAGKRKRQGTLGGKRDRSPLSKKEKGGQEVEDEDEEVEEVGMPQMK